ncbi:phage holin family protein [Gymnodinialimonas ulvae]|uniref:phage holin family protein n=1 Tax=Gymnodinialimonas ulvae TaxID=3126504 RepID=UPI0030969595
MPGPSPSPLSHAARLLEAAAGMAKHEFRLARAEISENLGHARVGAALIGAAAMIALVAVFVLSVAAVAGLAAAGLPVWMAALIMGGALALIAGVLLALGLSKVKAKRLIPDRTLSNIQRDMQVLKEAANA